MLKLCSYQLITYNYKSLQWISQIICYFCIRLTEYHFGYCWPDVVAIWISLDNSMTSRICIHIFIYIYNIHVIHVTYIYVFIYNIYIYIYI